MASKYRKIIVEKLSNKNYIPSILARETNFHFPHISRALRELENKNIVTCLNKSSKKGRIYTLTEFGKEVSRNIESEF